MRTLPFPIKVFLWFCLSISSAITIACLSIYLYLVPSLPDTNELKNVELQTPLRIYSQDGRLIGEFGEKKRNPLKYEEVPARFIQALLASEDDGFFQHGGIDIKGLLRASGQLVVSGRIRSGGSTITMQVAKNYFLSSEKSFSRKFTEILLALKIEQNLTKEEILELYVNKIFLGKSAYGIQAAAQVYYGKPINELTLSETAMIAGLPQAPSAANPLNNPKRAIDRRNYVLSRMKVLGMIDQSTYDEAIKQPVTASNHGSAVEHPAPYIAEMVRQKLEETYGHRIYTEGFIVSTTIDSRAQLAASEALQHGLLAYDRAHGWREKPAMARMETVQKNGSPVEFSQFVEVEPLANGLYIDWVATLENWRSDLFPQDSRSLVFKAHVSKVQEDGAWVFDGSEFRFIEFDGMKWAAPYINVNVIGRKPKRPSDVLQLGQIVEVEPTDDGLLLSQLPEVQGALVSLNPENGAIIALVGGYEQSSNQFNRVIQAYRQPGSSFKPFVYSAALANGFTPATIINDAPVVFADAGLENTWRPENYSGKFHGPTRLRQALYKSQNLVSIRVLKQITPAVAVNYIAPLGFPKEQLNADLSLALGASAVTPMQLATGYASLANGGFAISPYFIERVEKENGEVLFNAEPLVAADPVEEEPSQNGDFVSVSEPRALAPRVMEPDVNFLITSMLKDVIRRGTGRKALALERNDLAGKTGTTNDQVDAWFSGFNESLVTTVWVGFDQPVTMGRWAFGGSTALPIWVDYMRVALEGIPEHSREQPDNITSVKIDPETGLLAAPGQTDAIFEYFRKENAPVETAISESAVFEEERDDSLNATPELLF